MSTGLHRDLEIAELHRIQSLEYADEAARTGATGLDSDDIGRIARQLDDDSFWLLTDDSPLTWLQLGGVGVPASRVLTAGAGLTGGGDLSADRTFNVAAADGSISVGADSIGVGVLQSDAQHGARGGGTQHNAATPSVNGFLSAADKTKLDDLYNERYDGESNGTSGTTSTSLQTKLDVTETFEGGDYKISWYCETQIDTLDEFVRINVILDPGAGGEETLAFNDQPFTLSPNYTDHNCGGFAIRTLGAGSHTIRIGWSTIDGGYTAYVRRARIFVERIG